MKQDIAFISTQIAQTKAKLFDLTFSREQEEKKLAALHGALETLQMLEEKQQAANVPAN
jgi:flagellar biosynthesis chaperone FliJ